MTKLSRDADPSHRAYLARRPERHRGFDRTSRYLVMRDGTRIAIDVCLPRGLPAGARIPTIVRQTRYFRRFLVRKRARLVLDETGLDPMNAPMRALFTSRGYAWVDVDVRGSGASFGERPCPWWLEGEVKDGAEVVDFIVKQPWSNGLVGSTGVSYDGTTAELLAWNAHPAVRAVAPRFSLYDGYADVAFPGGLHQAWFTETWELANAALDRNAPEAFIGTALSFGVHGAPSASVADRRKLASRIAHLVDHELTQRALGGVLSFALGGVPPVDDDAGGAQLAAAVASHVGNYNVHHGAVHMTFRDDSPPDAPLPGFTVDYFSPSTYPGQVGDAAVLGYSGWFDGGYANAAVKRHRVLERASKEHRLLLGPWVHGGTLDMDPDTDAHASAFDHSVELLRFFDRHLAATTELPGGTVIEDTAPVRYYVMGAGAWRAASTWPPEGTRSLALHLAAGHRLRRGALGDGADVHEVDLTTGTGRRTRWRTTISPFVHADGAGRSRRGLLVYDGDVLEEDLEVAGNPVLVLRLASTVPDGAIFAYLEDVDREGRARLVTEGELRTIHRTTLIESDDAAARVETSFLRKDAIALAPGEVATHAIELLPLAMLFRRGHRIRLSLAGADVDHFVTPVGKGKRVTWTIERAGSRLLLPTRAR
ncbi:MAG: hydrolase [Myxococcaceae bacterium]|nr:hydrolase [Myxococcaceae bacterium]